MKKSAVLICVLLVAFAAALAYAATAPDKVVLNESGKKGPVYFDHKAHTSRAAACQECHHKNAPGTEQKCSECHKSKMENGVVGSKDALHTTCKDCHKKNGGSTKCDSCHTKK